MVQFGYKCEEILRAITLDVVESSEALFQADVMNPGLPYCFDSVSGS